MHRRIRREFRKFVLGFELRKEASQGDLMNCKGCGGQLPPLNGIEAIADDINCWECDHVRDRLVNLLKGE
jgi:hypothetical protein